MKDVLAGGVDQYDAVYLPGGHGIMFDGNNSDLKALLEKFWNDGKVVSGAGGRSTSWARHRRWLRSKICQNVCWLLVSRVRSPAMGRRRYVVIP